MDHDHGNYLKIYISMYSKTQRRTGLRRDVGQSNVIKNNSWGKDPLSASLKLEPGDMRERSLCAFVTWYILLWMKPFW